MGDVFLKPAHVRLSHMEQFVLFSQYCFIIFEVAKYSIIYKYYITLFTITFSVQYTNQSGLFKLNV